MFALLEVSSTLYNLNPINIIQFKDRRRRGWIKVKMTVEKERVISPEIRGWELEGRFYNLLWVSS